MDKYKYGNNINMKIENIQGKVIEVKRENKGGKWYSNIVIKCIKNGEECEIPITYTHFCPTIEGDNIYGSIILNERNKYEFVNQPTAVPNADRDSIITLFLMALKGSITRNIAEKMYMFFSAEAEKNNERFLTIGVNDIEDPLYRTRNSNKHFIMETINSFVEREIVDKSTTDRLAEAIGINKQKCNRFIFWWRKNNTLRRLYLLGISKSEILDCIDRGWDITYLYYQLLENPYIVEKIPMEKCNEISNKYGIVVTNEMIQCGYIVRDIDKQCTEKSWVCYPMINLIRTTPNYQELQKILLKDFKCEIKYNFLYLRHQADVENFLSKELISKDINDTDPTPYICKNLCEEQINGLKLALNKSRCIIHGRPGSGKSYLISKIVSELNLRDIKYYIACPTGKACIRLKKIIPDSNSIMTLDMLCSRKVTLDDCDVLIIDENSMSYGNLIKKVLLKIMGGKEDGGSPRIIFLGDTRQLPSIEPGNFFEELLKSNMPRAELNMDHRRKDSVLFNNIAALCEDRFNDFKWDDNCSYVRGDIPQIQSIVFSLAEIMKNQGIPIKAISNEITIITPYNFFNGPNSEKYNIIEVLNNYCRSIFVPTDAGFIIDSFGKKWCVGDRIMVTKNEYNVGLYNGQEGEIIHIKSEGKLVCKFDTSIVEVPTFVKNVRKSENEEEDELAKVEEFSTKILVLSWAMTVHKSQGSEWEHVIFYVPRDKKPGGFLNKKLFFTAVSRARESLHVVCENEDVIESAMRYYPQIRFDNLSLRLLEIPYKNTYLNPTEVQETINMKLRELKPELFEVKPQTEIMIDENFIDYYDDY